MVYVLVFATGKANKIKNKKKDVTMSYPAWGMSTLVVQLRHHDE